MKQPPKILWILAPLSGIGAIVVFVWFGYFAQLFLPPTGSGEVSTHSALLPSNWETYRSDVWSVGYPKDFEVHTRDDGAVWFLPSGVVDKKTYFLVTQESTTLDAYKITRDAAGYLPPTDVTISNYPAAKYVVGSSYTEYVVSYHNGLVIVASDEIDDETIAIMFATFTLKTE
ncbi:MAG: hypothetical protein AAB473_02085 [Patescibacteria group bacterium]